MSLTRWHLPNPSETTDANRTRLEAITLCNENLCNENQCNNDLCNNALCNKDRLNDDRCHNDLERTKLALDAGRLDEAFTLIQFALLKSSPYRHHHETQMLTDRIISELIRRGNQHFDEQRPDDAQYDADAAFQLGGRQIEIAKLRHRIAQHDRKMRRPKADAMKTHAKLTGDILQVDGIGSLLLLQSDTVSIGPRSSSTQYDIVLQTEDNTEPISINRDEEDYFLRTPQQRLLSSCDSISVGRRGRLRFTKPVAASDSAILEINGVMLLRRDVRRVVLLADSLLFGKSGCHFSLPTSGPPVILQPTRDGYSLHRQGGFDVQNLKTGGSVSIEGTRFTLTTHSKSEAMV